MLQKLLLWAAKINWVLLWCSSSKGHLCMGLWSAPITSTWVLPRIPGSTIQIESALPSISRAIMSLDGNEDAIVGAFKQSLRQLESLGAQRAGLEDMLKEMKRKDDILPKLMVGVGSHGKWTPKVACFNRRIDAPAGWPQLSPVLPHSCGLRRALQ